jgi:hypothetical protein
MTEMGDSLAAWHRISGFSPESPLTMTHAAGLLARPQPGCLPIPFLAEQWLDVPVWFSRKWQEKVFTATGIAPEFDRTSLLMTPTKAGVNRMSSEVRGKTQEIIFFRINIKIRHVSHTYYLHPAA